MNVEEVAYESLRTLRPAAITYTAGAVSLPLIAVRGGTATETNPKTNFATNARTEDFLILASELVNDDQAIEPTPGHRINQTINGRSVNFEVIRKGDGPCWRYSGTEHSILRIHTKML